MKKVHSLILAVCLCLGLCACGKANAAMIPHTYEDLTISLPEDFIDLSQEDYAAGLAFLHGLDPIAVNGLREEKALFASYGLDLDLQRYAKLVIIANNLSIQPEEKDGVLTFSYEAVVTLWETDQAFWTVQAYCPTENYPKVQDRMWQILKSVTV